MTNEEAIKLISERAQELAEDPLVKEAMRNLYEGGARYTCMRVWSR